MGRGGLAGVWDRNKKFIKPIATIGAGMLGGPLAGMAVGGLMGGADREGKSGIGFDVGKGIMGGAQGYVSGGMGSALKSGIASRLGIGAAKGLTDVAIPEFGFDAATGAITGKAAASSAAKVAGKAAQTAATAAPSFRERLTSGKSLAAMGSAASKAMEMQQQNRYYELQKQQFEAAEADRRRQREREAGMDPMRAQLLESLYKRIGG